MKKRIIYLDILKILSTILVIFNHSHTYLNGNSKLFKIIYIFSFNICKIAVPIFIMCTGALILNKKTTYDIVLKKRIPRIAIATLICTIIGAIYYKKDLLFVVSILWSGQTQTLYFLWYIYILIYIYLLTPFTYNAIKKYKKKDYKIFLIIFIIIPSTILFIGPLIKELFGIDLYITSRLIHSSFLVNIGLIVLGNYINKHKINKIENKVINIVIIVTIIIGCIYTYFGYRNHGQMPDYYYNTLPPVILSICVFIKIKNYIENKKINKKLNSIITICSESTFGVYLFHVFIIDIICHTSYSKFLNRYNLLSYALLIIITYTSLTLLFYLLKKIKIFKKIF